MRPVTSGSNFTAYVRIDVYGDGFDAQAFHSQLPKDLAGELSVARNRSSGVSRLDWKSKEIPIGSDRDFSSAIGTLLSFYDVFLKQLPRQDGPCIAAIAVYKYVAEAGPCGLYLAPDVVRALADLGAYFDYDVY